MRAYPRRWRERYGDELLALLESQPLTWRTRANIVASGLAERLRGSGPKELRVLWAWSLFVVGGMAFQKTSEHWQSVVPGGDRAVPTAAFDAVQIAAAVGSAAVLAAVAIALPAFLRDLRSGGWIVLRRPILSAAAGTAVAAGSLIAVAITHDLGAVSIFVASAVYSLFGWTHAATLAARRLVPLPGAQTQLALVASAAMVVITIAAAVWFVSVTAHAPAFVGVAHVAVTATFMLLGSGISVVAVRSAQA